LQTLLTFLQELLVLQPLLLVIILGVRLFCPQELKMFRIQQTQCLESEPMKLLEFLHQQN